MVFGDTNARCYEPFRIAHLFAGFLDRGPDLLADDARALFPGADQNDHELVAAVPPRQVSQADVGAALPRRFLEHRVARLMPEPVVHLLEVVEVQEQHREPVPRTVAPCDLVRQSIAQHAERREPGQRIDRGLLLRERRLALEIARTGLQGGPAQCRRHRELAARRVAARPRIPGPPVRRKADLVEHLFHRFDRRTGVVHFDGERRPDLDAHAFP